MKQMVRIYSIENCPYCTELKELLTNGSIEFVDINVNLQENEAEYAKIAEVTKSDQVPIVKIGKHLLVPNVSFKSIKECSVLVDKFLKEE